MHAHPLGNSSCPKMQRIHCLLRCTRMLMQGYWEVLLGTKIRKTERKLNAYKKRIRIAWKSQLKGRCFQIKVSIRALRWIMPMAAFHRCYWDNRYCNSALRSGRLRFFGFFAGRRWRRGMSNLPPHAERFQQQFADCYQTKNLSEYDLPEMSLELSSRLRSRFKGYPYKTAFAAWSDTFANITTAKHRGDALCWFCGRAYRHHWQTKFSLKIWYEMVSSAYIGSISSLMLV